ncbi:MAG TPA: cytochrome C [Bradyrhizobium sp.]|uniref:cytochrome C n=1 Tax=Bradyrhizobium sp. TaxID=376 RepID=UPI002B8CBE17|nr:cytochrome C [Bradyrhizobium sp.]HLZ01194.1 cytochrome C [Bradyrhizobium sp.]
MTATILIVGSVTPANALPSFARQTGQPCGTCHTDFPALTPYGRRFKLLGYTPGGGPFRTTPFSSNAGIAARAEYQKLRAYASAVAGPPAPGASDLNANASINGDDKEWVPPVSMMAIVGYTHTQAPLPPPTAPYNPNDNVVLSPFSAFWGGAITNDIGAFAQVTYNAPPPGGFGDPFGHTWTWDNTDVRFAGTGSLGPLDFIYGITANNNPSVQDVWNTTPAWSFPYAVSTILGPQQPTTIVEGAFAAHVGGVGVYTFINDLLYLEVTGYKTLSFSQQNAVGTDPFAAPGLLGGVAPYWRAAIEPHWGRHSFMLGTFGLYTQVHPWIDTSFASWTSDVFPMADKFTDIGFDSQYQYQGDNFWFTLRGSFIREFQRLDQTFANAGSSNLTNQLNTMKLQASLALGSDNRVVLTGQYFNVWGTSDAILFGTDPLTGVALTPNSNGWTAEIAYIPFGVSKSPLWPWFNARIGLQYTYYNKLNGTTVGAQNNNTLFLHAWFAM